MTEKSEFICILHDHSACPYCAEDFKALQTRLTLAEGTSADLAKRLQEAEGKLLGTEAKLEATRGFSSDLEKKLAVAEAQARVFKEMCEIKNEKLVKAEEELFLDNELLEGRFQIHKALPCPTHGEGCVPGTIQEILKAKTRIEALEAEIATANRQINNVLTPIPGELDTVGCLKNLVAEKEARIVELTALLADAGSVAGEGTEGKL